jgi:hypothetical protein
LRLESLRFAPLKSIPAELASASFAAGTPGTVVEATPPAHPPHVAAGKKKEAG